MRRLICVHARNPGTSALTLISTFNYQISEFSLAVVALVQLLKHGQSQLIQPERWSGYSGINRRLWILNGLGTTSFAFTLAATEEMGQLPWRRLRPSQAASCVGVSRP